MSTQKSNALHIEVTTKTLEPMLEHVLQKSLVPMIHGDPAIGKSDLLHAIADSQNLMLIDIRLATVDPVYLNGVLSANAARTKGTFLPLDNIPIKGDTLPQKFDDTGKAVGTYDGWLLFFDEITQCAPAIQAASYKILLDRQVGDHHLHERVRVAAAGNLTTSGAIASKMNTAMQSRMIHFVLRSDHKAWMEWATNNAIDHRVVSYLAYKPEFLHRFDPKHQDLTFPAGRTWKFLSDLIQGANGIATPDLPKNKPMLAGTVGFGAATDFITYCKVYSSLPDVNAILTDPANAPLPHEPGAKWAIAGMVSQNLIELKDPAHRAALMEYLLRFEVSFQHIALVRALSQDKSIARTPKILQWVQKNSDLFSLV